MHGPRVNYTGNRCNASNQEGLAELIPARTYVDLCRKAEMLLRNVNYLFAAKHERNGHRNLLRSLARDILGGGASA